MTNFKYLQKLFFLLVMGFSISSICACGDDEEDEPVQNPNEEITNPTDSIPSEVKPIEPNDSIVSGKPSIINGHEAIDLGLSVKWATCNVGASFPEEYGDFYAWGETEEKEDYSMNTYKWCQGEYTSMTKYCSISHFGTVDERCVLELSDDVANIKWGKSWRMPIKSEIEELQDKCVWQMINNNNVNGYLITGPNGNSLFLPFSGGYYDTTVYSQGNGSGYWTATLHEEEQDCAYSLNINVDSYKLKFNNRCLGLPIRPVTD